MSQSNSRMWNDQEHMDKDSARIRWYLWIGGIVLTPVEKIKIDFDKDEIYKDYKSRTNH